MAGAGPAGDAVREGDRDRFLATLYAPEDKRGALFALSAFDIEIAALRDRVSQPLPGEIRLQWWRDTIAAGGAQAAGHPVADALIAAVEHHNLPRAAFDNYLEARIFDLYDDPMPSRTDLEGYCGETASAMIQLAAIVLDPAAAAASAELAGHAGCAQAMTGMLRRLPLHMRRGQCFVPADVLAAAGTLPEEFVRGEGGQAALRAVSAMVALARDHLAAFERHAGELPPVLRPAFLPLALTRAYLDRIEANTQRAFTGGLDISAVRRHWMLLRRASKGWA